MLELALMTSAILMGWSFGKMFYEASQANRPSLILTEAAIEPKTSENVVEAHHYCTKLNDDFWQCLIYDSPDKNARLIGIEYIISERLFTALPEEEQKYWHSHTHEVKGGVLVMPVVPYVPEAVRSTVDHIQMKQIVNTYGKTWHTWQVDRGDKLPFGPPQLMMAFTVEGQVDPKLIESRDKRFNLNTKDIIRARRDIHADHPTPDPRADHWQHAYEYQKAKELVGGSAKVVTNTGVPKGAVGIEEEPKVLQVDMRKVAFHSSHDRPEVARF
ncbi:hypothetical protein HK102_002435 [Quaeritorhiza haematococci]|nr:hypothetical protein HK102_002435 [Quaeritorhiza haematococci]